MEEKPVELPVSPQEVQIQPSSFLDKINPPAGGYKFKLFGGILGVLVFAGAVFGAYKLGQRQVQPGFQPTPTLIPIPTVVFSPTPEVSPRPTPTPSPKPITWKTYTNDTYGFQIKYPAEMVLGPEPKAPDPELLSSRSIYRSEAANSIGKGHINVAVRSTPLDDLVVSWERLANRTATQVKIDALKAKKIEWVDTNRTDGMNLYNQKILLARKNLTYEISLYVDNESSQKNDFLVIFDLMLSTFKFLD